MYHSITIGEKNTWDDWHLIPATRPLVNPPSVKTNYVDVPGGDGTLDLSTALAGRPLYNDRSGSWTFYVENGFMEWQDLFSAIMGYLHGQKLRAVLEDDPDYYYEGRFSVNAWKSDQQWSQITIDYEVGPYKKYVLGEDNWLWDTFNFETDSIRYYRNLAVRGTLEVTVIGDAMETVPVITSSVNGMKVTFEGTTYTLSRGSNQFSGIVLQNGENLLTFTGTGKISITITGGRL